MRSEPKLGNACACRPSSNAASESSSAAGDDALPAAPVDPDLEHRCSVPARVAQEHAPLGGARRATARGRSRRCSPRSRRSRTRRAGRRTPGAPRAPVRRSRCEARAGAPPGSAAAGSAVTAGSRSSKVSASTSLSRSAPSSSCVRSLEPIEMPRMPERRVGLQVEQDRGDLGHHPQLEARPVEQPRLGDQLAAARAARGWCGRTAASGAGCGRPCPRPASSASSSSRKTSGSRV